MSFRMWLDSLLSPDVTIEGRPARVVPRSDPFGLIAMVEAKQRVAEMQRAEYLRQKELARACHADQLRIMATIRAAELAVQDRPPVRQGRDL